MSGVPDYLKGDPSYWLSEAGQMTRALCESDLRDLAFYLDTLDTFVQERENAESQSILERHKDHDVNWAEEHPYWWQDIVGERVRCSFIIALMSTAEHYVSFACGDAELAFGLAIPVADLAGGWLQRSRKYFEKLATFSSPPPHTWDCLGGIYLVRNAFVHSGGMLDSTTKIKKAQGMLKAAPGITFKPPFIEIDTTFCRFAHKAVTEFFQLLHDQHQVRCKEVLSGTA